MPGEYLPPVIARLEMDLGDFEADIAAARALLKSLAGDAKFKVDVDTTAAQAKLKRLQHPGNVQLGVDLKTGAAAAKLAALEAAGDKANRGGFNFWGIPLTATALHWIISGSAEILAVAIPALVGLGAAAAAAGEGVQNVGQHMQAVFTATEATNKMFGQTAGNLIGLKSALQQAQTAADPKVYSILGSAVLTAQEHFGGLASTGTQIIGVFQTFAAKVAAEFQPGGVLASSTDKLLSHMTGDVTAFGQVFGNLGHFFLVFGAQMPGLAEILLGALAGVVKLAAGFVDLTSKIGVSGFTILTAVVAYEEFNRWGGLIAGTLAKVGLATRDKGMDAMVLSWTHFTGVLRTIYSILPGVIGQLGKLFSAVGLSGAGSSLTGAAAKLQAGIASLKGWQVAGIAIAAVGIGFLIDKIVTAQSAAQRLGIAMQNAVMQSSNVNAPKVIAANMAVLNAQITQGTQDLNNYGAAVRTGPRDAYDQAAAASKRLNLVGLNADLKQQQQDLLNVNQGAQWVAKTFSTTLEGALILADNASVHLSDGIIGQGKALTIDQMKIESLVQGYKSMGQTSGEVGADMTALAIQAGLQATKVDQLNSAWDSYMSTLTGGTTGLAGIVQSIANIGNVVATGAKNLDQAKNINLNPAQFANALTSFGSTGAQAWQNFGQVLQSVQQQIDWFRTAGAMGAIGPQQFSKAILGMVSSLTQFAAKSPTAQAQLLALAQQADPNIKTWSQLQQAIKQAGANMGATAAATENATQKLGNMAQVAQNLGNVMNANLLSTLSQATINASGAGSAMQKYAGDLMNAGTSAAQTRGDRTALINDLISLGYDAKQAAAFVNAVQAQIDQLHSKTVTVTVAYVTTGNYRGTVTYSGGGGQGYGGNLPGSTAGGGPHHAIGTPYAPRGWSWVGELGPELIRLRGGEQIIPHSQSMAMAGAADGGGAVHEINVYLDGRKLFQSVQKSAVQTQRRTGTAGFNRRTR